MGPKNKKKMKKIVSNVQEEALMNKFAQELGQNLESEGNESGS
jgi:hypothetical protein